MKLKLRLINILGYKRGCYYYRFYKHGIFDIDIFFKNHTDC